MTRGIIARAKAILLAAVFLGGGIGLPEFDALAYHLGSASQEPRQPHFDPLGGCHSHGDHCALGGVGPAPHHLPSRPGAVAQVLSADARTLRPSIVARFPSFLETACRPRAPPIHSS